MRTPQIDDVFRAILKHLKEATGIKNVSVKNRSESKRSNMPEVYHRNIGCQKIYE
jgi:hypothetical protein